MPLLSTYARRKKLDFFLPHLPEGARILEVGAGSGWLGRWLKGRGWDRYTSVDLAAPADVAGDIREWRRLGLEAASFDVVIAFEVVEHGDFYEAFFELLRPGGLLFVTTPLPRADRFLRLLEMFGLNQKRTSPHTHLHRLRDLSAFEPVTIRTVAGLSQWGVLRRPVED